MTVGERKGGETALLRRRLGRAECKDCGVLKPETDHLLTKEEGNGTELRKGEEQ